ncbi:MAG: DUF2254 domain-containing protein [Methylocystis sp.]|uniref:DUF2254 domain-containing protein n=1 Tax=Methylocystis sp. TaxID=1911079 RepID=UPI003D11F905
MQSKWAWRLSHFFQQLWVRVTLYAIAACVTAFAAFLLRAYVPHWVNQELGAEALESVLTILASSMLAVSTFSLGIMAAAIASASSNATPRATQLLLEEKTSQKVIATFLGAFVFSLVGIVALKMGIYGGAGRLLLFFVTLVVIVLMFWNFIRWIDLLREFGRFSDLLPRIENATAQALEERLESPYLGCHPLIAPPPEGAIPVHADRPGYVLHMDLIAAQGSTEEAGATVWIQVNPGSFAHRTKPLCYVSCPSIDQERMDELTETLRGVFSIGDNRTFEQDPRFGLIVLSETASRALSPAINDPGTAINVLTRGARLLALWETRSEAEVNFPNIYLPPLDVGDMFEDFFRPIARDGAAMIEVQIWLQKILLGLTRDDEKTFGKAALRQSAEALTRAETKLTLESEKQQIRAIAAEIAEAAQIVDAPTI